jgi:hypothetical protein
LDILFFLRPFGLFPGGAGLAVAAAPDFPLAGLLVAFSHDQKMVVYAPKLPIGSKIKKR